MHQLYWMVLGSQLLFASERNRSRCRFLMLLNWGFCVNKRTKYMWMHAPHEYPNDFLESESPPLLSDVLIPWRTRISWLVIISLYLFIPCSWESRTISCGFIHITLNGSPAFASPTVWNQPTLGDIKYSPFDNNFSFKCVVLACIVCMYM